MKAKPSMARMYDGGCYEISATKIGLPPDQVLTEEMLGLRVPGTEHGVAIKSGTADHGGMWTVSRLSDTVLRENGSIRFFCHRDHILADGDILAFPIDSRMTIADIQGASEAYLNVGETAWLFRHSRAGLHHDHLLAVRAAVVALFQPAIDNAIVKLVTTGNASTRALRKKLVDNLTAYRDSVIAAADAAEREHALGCYVQPADPDLGHVHKAVRDGMTATKRAWGATPAKLAQYRAIASLVSPLATAMQTPHAPQTRWEQAAATAAAKKASTESDGDGSS